MRLERDTRRGAAVLAAVAAMAFVAASASAHPGAPFKSTAWAKAQIFSPGKGKFDDRSATCVGFGTRRSALFRHFHCTEVRNDGIRFSMIVHAGLQPTVSFIEVVGPGGYRKRILGSKTISGDFATTVVSGTLAHPALLILRIFVTPDQRVTGNWTMVCSNDSGAGSKSGTFKSGYDLTDVRLDFPFDTPTDCTVSAAASVDGATRKLTLQLVGYYV